MRSQHAIGKTQTDRCPTIQLLPRGDLHIK